MRGTAAFSPAPRFLMTKRTKAGRAGSVASEGTTDSALPVVRIAYAGGANACGVRIVGEWARGEIKMVMSSSSGPKDYVKNMLCAAFDSKPEIERIRMVMNESNVPFCIYFVRGRWFDCSAKEVVFNA